MNGDKPNTPVSKDAKQATASQPAAINQTPAKGDAGKTKTSKAIPPAEPSGPVAPLFRRIDWITLILSTLFVFAGYVYTLAPNCTLEDSGELSVGSFYAGVPHPPGYPIWTIYTWLFTELVPISNIAYRVGLASAFASALACGLIGLMVSRGSSMMIESIDSLKDTDKKWENAFCLLTGYVASMLMGFNGFMWSQSVIVEVYSLSVLSLTAVLVFMLRWMYAPQQNRYLYLAFFMFGICFTNHQTLLLAAMGLQVAIVAAKPKLGRDFVLFNSIIYIAALLMKANGMLTQFNAGPGQVNMMFVIFNMVGIASLITLGWLIVTTQKILTEYKVVLICGLLFILGAAFYFFMPITSMSNPPMNWGYPRTEEGFWHALTRGQYEKANPVNIFSDPLRFIKQMWDYCGGMVEEFTLVYLVIGLIPFAYFTRMQRREKAWIVGLSAIYFCLAVILMIMLNPSPDRQSQGLNRVFFTSSHVMVCMAIGYGLALLGATLYKFYQDYRQHMLIGSAVATAIALYVVVVVFGDPELSQDAEGFFGVVANKSPSVRFAALFGLGLSLFSVGMFAISRKTAPMMALLGLYFLLPFKSVISHWEENEQRGHLFGYWFGHDMFTPPFTGKDGKPLFPEMDRDTVLFGGTDPGRFNPTYMIFCESFIPPSKKSEDPNFDRRDVYLITQNALADGTYLNYIRAHYNRSAQIDPPFFQEFLRPTEETAKNYKTNLLARMAIPLDRFFLKLGDNIEKRRRVGSSFFKDDHFANLADLAKKINSGGEPAALSKFIKENLSEDTRSKLGQPDKALAKALAKDLNVLLEKELVYEPNRFTGVTLKPTTMRFINQNPKSHTRIRLNRLLLEEAYPKDIIKSLGGVYPDREIITPSPADSQKCFQEYLEDAQKRFANHQLRPGEDVRVEGGRVQVSGQVAVMAINALLTKVIFDKNPDHEFYVEESFPLDWMYPYLTPFGIIMKINRNPLPELPQDTIDRDHEFWSKYSDRLIGNWITYDTPVSNVCDFAERIYLHRDYSKFKGDPKFIRDDNAQKAFSKLRSSIGGVYNWRIANARNQPERDRMIKEAEFAFKQALAYCPFSPEAVFRYVNLLLSLNQPGRLDDAIKIAQTCKKLDPSNAQVDDLMRKLKEIRQSMGTALEMQSKLSGIEGKFKSEPTVSNAFSLANVYMSLGRSNDAVRVLGAALNHPQTDAGAVISIANAFVQLNQVGMLEQALGRLVTLTPDSPEAWYDYAGVLSIVGKTTNAVESLTKALALSGERMKKDTKARNLKDESLKDPRFNILRGMPEFQKLLDQK